MDVSLSSSQVKQKALELGFHKVGIAAVDANIVSKSVERLQVWLGNGYQANMEWMANPKRQDIRQVMPSVQSIITVALNYYTAHQRPEGSQYGKISRYGWGRDYHRVMDKKLKLLANWLRSARGLSFPEHPPMLCAGCDTTGWVLPETTEKSHSCGVEVRYYADTGPVQDKVWAQAAGIGWIAKNGNVITREYGSWVFLGEVLTNIVLTPDGPHTEHCGTCTRCIDACPTGAIAQPFVVDANRCIAYHTIENRVSSLPEEIAGDLEGWVAGCDICQDVCPWNQRFASITDITEFNPYPENVAPKLSELAKISDAEWNRRFRASALRRIKPEMLRRNARANLEADKASAELDK
ncbi:MAG: tRNA epoxyqueuosine(34) reductase QueG [Hormoscilla sp. GUM202]|nr:tRNA epoxyqueuosine(34) reductase QueG [Hormoscilla sp. GUM202]